MSKTTVSLRAAAKALEMPPTSLTRWLLQEPSLAAAVVSQPGPRQAMEIDLECLQAAWSALQGGQTPIEQLSERERLRRERQQRLYWQGQELRQQVLALEQQYVLAKEVAEATKSIRQHIRTALENWLTAITPKLATRDPQKRYQILSHGVHDLLAAIAGAHAPNDTSTAEQGCLLEPSKSETQCRIEIEHYRARLHQLKAQIHSKEIIPASDVKAKAWTEARLLRDQLLAMPARCAAQVEDADALRREMAACLHLQ